MDGESIREYHTAPSTCRFAAVPVAASAAETRLVGGGKAFGPYRSRRGRVYHFRLHFRTRDMNARNPDQSRPGFFNECPNF
jgi:hypothetical protein